MFISMFLFVSLLLLLWILLTQLYNNIKFWQKVNRIPILPGLPLIGVANEAIGSIENFFKLCMELAKIEAPILGVWFGPKYYVRIKDPVHIQTILNSSQCLDKGSDAVKINHRWIGTGLEMSPGHIWKGHRKTIAHCFNTITLQSFLNVFERQTEKTITDLTLTMHKKPNNNPFNILIYSCSFSLRSICETTFGIKSALDSTECIEFIDASHTLVKILMKRITNLIYFFDWIYFMTPLYRHEKRTLEQINSFTQKLILEKKQNVETINNRLKRTSNEQFEDGFKKSNIFLEQLITNTNFSNKLIEHQVNVMIFAGHETSGSALAFTILMLAIHQDIQEKIIEEIFENLSSINTRTNYNEIGIDTDTVNNCLQMNDLKKFTYLEMVIFETLRLFPVGPLLSRYTTGDLKLGDITIPAGVDIFILIYGLHRDVKYWGVNADKFNPDNFLPEAIAKRHPFSFLPFSGGPRNCIGYKYAMLSMKIFLIRMLQQFEFKTHLTFDDVRVKQELVLKIDGEHTVYLSKRKRVIDII